MMFGFHGKLLNSTLAILRSYLKHMITVGPSYRSGFTRQSQRLYKRVRARLLGEGFSNVPHPTISGQLTNTTNGSELDSGFTLDWTHSVDESYGSKCGGQTQTPA